MNILFCGDSGVCPGVYLSALSLCRHTEEALSFYLLTASYDTYTAISETFAEQLRRAVKAENSAHCVRLVDITDLFCKNLPTANMSTRFTPLCMLRLFADMVPEIPDRILYLDADVLCRGEFRSLYDVDMSAAEIAGVPDRYGKWFFGHRLRHDYLNSGVLLMNMVNIRQSGLLERCRAMCRDTEMFMPDQSALNRLAVKKRVAVRYNEQGRIKENTVFKHFTTFFRLFPYPHPVTVKPWHAERLHRELKIFEFDDLLEEYQRSCQV